MELWQRFTSAARRAVLLAHTEATCRHAPLISIEDLLAGLLRLSEGTATEILWDMRTDVDSLCTDLRQQLETADAGEVTQEVAFTPAAQRALTRAYGEAKELGDYHLGTAHLLIGLLQEGDDPGSSLLRRYGVELPRVRQALAKYRAFDGSSGE